MNQENYAGFWIRLRASFIDLIIMMIVIFLPLSIIYGEAYWSSDNYYLGFWDICLGEVVPMVATILFWVKYFGTPGKMITRLKVVDAQTGNRLTVGQAILRYFSYFLSILALGVGFFSIGWDKKKQGWHDKLAGTVVIKNNKSDYVKTDDIV